MSEAIPVVPLPQDVEAQQSAQPGELGKHGQKKKKPFGFGKTKSANAAGIDAGVEEAENTSTSSTPFSSAPVTVPVLTRSPPTNAAQPSPALPMTPISTTHKDGAGSPQSPLSITGASGTSPFRLPRSASPRMLSPASSLIFERNVQESHILPDDISGNIPSHIQTEDHIPAVLEASSRAITSDDLDPDEVEILTHSLHTPAAVSVAASTSHGEGVSLHSPTSMSISPFASQDLASNGSEIMEETASSYGNLDPTDVRRLSFISFADVVQGENAEAMGPRDSILHGPLSLSPARNRSPSPVRSPASASSQAFSGAASPPKSGGSSFKGVSRNITSAPGSAVPAGTIGSIGSSFSGGKASPSSGELVMEKMSAALKVLGPSTADEAPAGQQTPPAVALGK